MGVFDRAFWRILVAAVRDNDASEVQSVLRQQPNLNTLEPYEQFVVLREAVMFGNDVIAEMLLEAGCKIQYDALREAISTDNIEILRVLLRFGADVDHRNDLGETPLQLAVVHAEREIVIMLLEAGADANAMDSSGYTVLHHCAYRVIRDDIVSDLVIFGAKLDVLSIPDGDEVAVTPLHLAAMNANEHIGKMLLNAGANVNSLDSNGAAVIQYIVKNKYIQNKRKLIRYLLQQGADINSVDINGLTALHQAAIRNDDVLVDFLLDQGADFQQTTTTNNWTLLHWAAGANEHESHYKVLKSLLSRGVNIHARDSDGNTAFLFVLHTASINVTQLFIEYGANVFDQNDNQVATLHAAVGEGLDIDVFKLLISRGVSIDVVGQVGFTALHYAAQKLNVSAVRFLLQNGANVNTKNVYGHTPLSLVMMMNDDVFSNPLFDFGKERLLFVRDLIQIFLDYGADLNVRGYRSYETIFNETTIRASPILWKIFIMHIAKLHILMQPVFESIYNVIKNNNDTKRFFERCIKELEKMKKYGSGRATFFHILTGPFDKTIKYARNKELVDEIGQTNIKREFPIYGKSIAKTFVRAKTRQTIVTNTELTLIRLAPFPRLPMCVASKITEYLSYKDMEIMRYI